jgi:hypothetical protein
MSSPDRARPSALAAALAALVLAAGCLGALPVERDAAGTDATASPAATQTPTAAAPGTPPANNPWPTPATVAVEGGPDAVRAARNATRYWERVDERYLGFDVEYEVVPDATDPDLVVAVVASVPDCDGVADAAGCAPLVRGAWRADRPGRIYVRDGLAPASTALVARHEFGHTLGLDHGDAPADVMAARSVLYTEPRPNATERAFPWNDTVLPVRVTVAADAGVDPGTARRQVDHARSYYERGAPGMPAVTLSDAGDRRPEVVVWIGPATACEGAGSCVRTGGVDPDGDGAIEEYTRLEITVAGVDAAAIGWHVGYWLAHGLGAEADAEKPPPFRSADHDERRSRWWA